MAIQKPLSHHELCSEYLKHIALIAPLQEPLLLYGHPGLRTLFFAYHIHRKSNNAGLLFKQIDAFSFLPAKDNSFMHQLKSYAALDNIGSLFIKNIQLLTPSLQRELYYFIINEKKARIIALASGDLFLRTKEKKFSKKLFYLLQNSPLELISV